MTRNAPTSAVLTGDVVHSTALSSSKADELIRGLEECFSTNAFEFYRGDAFQVYLIDANEALRTALICRCLAIALSDGMDSASSDVRIGIGIGEVDIPVGKLGTARGEAFVLSGRGFDGLADSGERLILAANGVWPGLALQVLSDNINGIFAALTARQAEVVTEMLRGKTQRDAATYLQKSQSTIHQHLVAARWQQLEKCLTYYRKIIGLLNEQ